MATTAVVPSYCDDDLCRRWMVGLVASVLKLEEERSSTV